MSEENNKDGVHHIWLSQASCTELGRALYIGAKREFEHPEFGKFSSIIAFWVWLDSNRNDALRTIHHDAMVRSSLTRMKDTPGNRTKVVEALCCSVLQDMNLVRMIRDSTLPFMSYEMIGGSHYPLKDRAWYANALENLRKEIISTVQEC